MPPARHALCGHGLRSFILGLRVFSRGHVRLRGARCFTSNPAHTHPDSLPRYVVNKISDDMTFCYPPRYTTSFAPTSPQVCSTSATMINVPRSVQVPRYNTELRCCNPTAGAGESRDPTRALQCHDVYVLLHKRIHGYLFGATRFTPPSAVNPIGSHYLRSRGCRHSHDRSPHFR